MGPGELARRRDLLRRRASSAFDWEVGETNQGPFTIESLGDEQLCIPGMLHAARRFECEGFSALVIGCFADPGLELARSSLRIPVIGPGEASLHLACTLGKVFGILTISDNVLPLIHKFVKTAGFADRMASVRTVGTTVLRVADDRGAMLQRLTAAGEVALSRDGAEVLIVGCMSLAFLNVAVDLSQSLRAPVVCPLTAVIEQTESLLRLDRQDSQRQLIDAESSVPVIPGE
jgi:allantoin racemase